jgi:transcriptional regulator with XRE-family HTH domain
MSPLLDTDNNTFCIRVNQDFNTNCQLIGRHTLCNVGKMEWTDLIKAALAAQELTQDDLAETLGVTQGAIGHWLNARREPPFEMLRKMAVELGIDAATLGAALMGAAPPEGAEAIVQPRSRLNTDEKFLLDRYSAASQERRDQALITLMGGGVNQDKLDSEIMAGFDMAELGPKIDAYYSARGSTEKIAAADKVVNFIDRRQRQEYPPDKEFKRASDAK